MRQFKTDKKENFKSKIRRLAFNLFPAIRGTGVWVSFISEDWRELHIRLPLSWRTRNYVGTVFGGSIYASTDPFYMLQLMKILGKEYVVWDKAANIKFKRPIKKTVYTRFLITDKILKEIKEKVEQHGSYTIDLPVLLQDKQEVIYAEIIKTIYIADKAYYQSRKK
jgi:acyl-coenzyme A thioesterase PaaI-like protein